MQYLKYPNVTNTTDMKDYFKTFTVRDFWELLTRIDSTGTVFRRPYSVDLFDGYLLALEGMLDFMDTQRNRLRMVDEFKDYVRLNPPQDVQMRALPRWTKVMEFMDQSLAHILTDNMTRVDTLNDSQSYDMMYDIQEPQASRGADRLNKLFTAEEQEAHQRDFLEEYNARDLTQWQS